MGKSCGIKTMISKKSTTTHIVIFLPLEVILSGYAFRSNIYLQKIGLSRINSFDFYYIFRVLSLLVYNSLLIQTTLSWSIWTLSQIMYFHTLVQSFILYIRVIHVLMIKVTVVTFFFCHAKLYLSVMKKLLTCSVTLQIWYFKTKHM